MPSAVAVLSKFSPSSARNMAAGRDDVPSRSRTVLSYSVLLRRVDGDAPGVDALRDGDAATDTGAAARARLAPCRSRPSR